MKTQWQNPRQIKERIIVQGTLVLETPTHLGTGDADGLLDMPILVDPQEGRALLPGSSIAGALRNYVRERDSKLADRLFGTLCRKQGGDESYQSRLIVDDALGSVPQVELRDGVAIDPETRTAVTGKKFDIELIEAGTEFPISFELLLLQNDSDDLLRAFALALKGLQEGEIRLGKRKRRGFGHCRVREWVVQRYEVGTPAGMIDWLEGKCTEQERGTDIASLLKVSLGDLGSGKECTLEGTFVLDGSILIRSNSAGKSVAPDSSHLRSRRNGVVQPILSGTSLAGALRARTLRIANTLGKDGKVVADRLFGYRPEPGEYRKRLSASRIWTEETVIENGLDLVHSRVRIDRFTGGAYPGALFSEQAVYGKLNQETIVHISFRLQNASDSEVGLLLLLLKDLWTGDLPLGGETGVGRGRLRGKHATLRCGDDKWKFVQEGSSLRVEGDRARLESFVEAFVEGEI